MLPLFVLVGLSASSASAVASNVTCTHVSGNIHKVILSGCSPSSEIGSSGILTENSSLTAFTIRWQSGLTSTGTTTVKKCHLPNCGGLTTGPQVRCQNIDVPSCSVLTINVTGGTAPLVGRTTSFAFRPSTGAVSLPAKQTIHLSAP